MILRYGAYSHAADECEVIRSIRRDFSPEGKTLTVTRRWQVAGKLHGADAAGVIAAKNALDVAYSIPFQSFYLYLNDGITLHDLMLDRGSKHGVRIVEGPDYPVAKGAEGSTFISYSLAGEADYVFSRFGSTDPQRLQSFTETVSMTGGGPRYAVVEVVDGPPVRQLLNTQTKVRVIQKGSATGYETWPPLPPPIYPDFENPSERQTDKTSPQDQGRGSSSGFGVTWQYVMEGSAGDMGGADPTAWPAG